MHYLPQCFTLRASLCAIAFCAALPLHAEPVGGSWEQIHIHRSCEALNPLYCIGKHGLTVQRNGHYQIGPNAAGKKVGGDLSAEELAQLERDVAKVVANIALDPHPACSTTGQRIPGVGGNTLLSIMNKEYDLGHSSRPCAYHGDMAASIMLEGRMAQLLQKYYQVPF